MTVCVPETLKMQQPLTQENGRPDPGKIKDSAAEDEGWRPGSSL